MEKWGASLDGDEGYGRSLSFGYGTLLSDSLGTGIRLTRAGTYSEVLVKSVFAPEEGVRIHFAGSQLRQLDGDALASGIRPDSVAQNSLVLGLRRHFGEDRQLTDVSLAAYAVEARGRVSPDFASDGIAEIDPFAPGMARGRKNGYLLEFGLRPTPNSRIEYRRELGRLRYGLGAALHSEERLVSNRVGYAHRFDNCLRLAGGYSADAYSGHVDFGLARDNWRLAFERAIGGTDTSIRIGYSIPLGRQGRPAQDCGEAPSSPSPFTPMIDAVTSRPLLFPQEPLLTTDLGE